MHLNLHLLIITILSILLTSGCLSSTQQQTNQTEPPLPPPIPALPTEGNVAVVDSITGMTPHSTYSGFAEPEAFNLPAEYTFSSLSDSDTISLTINDDYIYRYAFISYDGQLMNGASIITDPERGSDLIDAGVDVGMPYNGAAPDLGPFETDY